MLRILNLVLVILIASNAAPALSTDFVILPDPQSLIIYDKYQHKLPDQKRREFPARTPMKILEASAYLSDQYTRVMKTHFNGSDYFLELNSDDQIINDDHSVATLVDIYSECRELSDTLQVMTEKTVRLLARPGDMQSIRLLEKGDLMNGIFRHKNHIFVRIQGRFPEYGWLPLSDKRYLQTVEVRKARQTILLPERIKNQITERFDEVNSLYIQYFSFMNERYRQYKSPPRWEVRSSPSSMTLRLTLPEYAPILSGSTQYLVQELEGYLIGTPFNIYVQDGVIEIRI